MIPGSFDPNEVIQGDDGKRIVRIPGRFDLEEPGDTEWLVRNHLFIPPPNFVNFSGQTTQKTMGMVRGVPGPFSRNVAVIGSYHIGFLEYAISRTPSHTLEMERYIRVAMTPDGYGGFCLLFQCRETEDPSVWMCLKPERE